MNFDTKQNNESATVVSLVDKLDTTNAPDLKTKFVVLNNDGINNIIFDLSKTKYCDSSGLSAILVGNRTCKNSSGHFILCGLQKSVEKLIEISQLNRVLPIAQNEEEAKELLNKLQSESVS